jgi:hypothetical protein
MVTSLAIKILSILLIGEQNSGKTVEDVQRSHIEANVPAPSNFTRFLRRDLADYFAKVRRGHKPPKVDFEMLRDGPTQSGVSYPKFYLWVRVESGKTVDDRGAVRVEAIERTRFAITDFVSERAIRGDSIGLRRVFPGPVCEKIEQKIGIVPPQRP